MCKCLILCGGPVNFSGCYEFIKFRLGSLLPNSAIAARQKSAKCAGAHEQADNNADAVLLDSYCFASARRPGHGPAPENVEMQVENSLPGFGPVVHDQAAIFRAVFPGQLRADPDDLADESFVFTCNRARAAEVFFGNDQKVLGCLGANVPEGENIFIFEQFFGRYFPVDDPAEKTGVAHRFSLFVRYLNP